MKPVVLSLLLFVFNKVQSELSMCSANHLNHPKTANTTRELKKGEVLQELFCNQHYDETHLPPTENDTGPVNVSVYIRIRSVENVDDVKMQYTSQIHFHQEWVDQRLNYENFTTEKVIQDYMLLPSKSHYDIWTPDIFFRNEKSGQLHYLTSPNSYTRIYRNGLVHQSSRITLVLSCNMYLQSYPLDIQTCPLNIGSYGWTSKNVLLHWSTSFPVTLKQRDFSNARFRLLHLHGESPGRSGEYSSLTVSIKFERDFDYYLIQIYLPCSMLVIVSWVSFWLEPSAVEARLSLGVTTILAVVTQTYGINQNAPPTSYAKALDVWTAWCQAMVFGALLEFAGINYLCHKEKMRSDMKKDDGKMEKSKAENVSMTEGDSASAALTRAKKIDKASRVLFPMAFAMFNLFYWCKYLWKLY